MPSKLRAGKIEYQPPWELTTLLDTYLFPWTRKNTSNSTLTTQSPCTILVCRPLVSCTLIHKNKLLWFGCNANSECEICMLVYAPLNSLLGKLSVEYWEFHSALHEQLHTLFIQYPHLLSCWWRDYGPANSLESFLRFIEVGVTSFVDRRWTATISFYYSRDGTRTWGQLTATLWAFMWCGCPTNWWSHVGCSTVLFSLQCCIIFLWTLSTTPVIAQISFRSLLHIHIPATVQHKAVGIVCPIGIKERETKSHTNPEWFSTASIHVRLCWWVSLMPFLSHSLSPSAAVLEIKINWLSGRLNFRRLNLL